MLIVIGPERTGAETQQTDSAQRSSSISREGLANLDFFGEGEARSEAEDFLFQIHHGFFFDMLSFLSHKSGRKPERLSIRWFLESWIISPLKCRPGYECSPLFSVIGIVPMIQTVRQPKKLGHHLTSPNLLS
ncbi:MAG: hypothetical protein ACKO23_17950, partial [Gemmataceae bacterium]